MHSLLLWHCPNKLIFFCLVNTFVTYTAPTSWTLLLDNKQYTANCTSTNYILHTTYLTITTVTAHDTHCPLHTAVHCTTQVEELGLLEAPLLDLSCLEQIIETLPCLTLVRPCLLPPASCLLPPTSCLLPPASCRPVLFSVRGVSDVRFCVF